MSDVNEKLAEIRETLRDIISNHNDFEKHNIEYKVLLQEHIKQDEQIYVELHTIKEKQIEHSQLLAIYNQQLEIHIEGVQELKRMNKLIEEQIDLIKEATEARLKILEAPMIWFSQTSKYAKWITGLGAAGAAIYGAIKVIKGL